MKEQLPAQPGRDNSTELAGASRTACMMPSTSVPSPAFFTLAGDSPTKASLQASAHSLTLRVPKIQQNTIRIHIFTLFPDSLAMQHKY